MRVIGFYWKCFVKIMAGVASVLSAVFSFSAFAGSPPKQMVYRYVNVPNKVAREVAIGLINADQSLVEGCMRRAGLVKVDGIQFSASGVILESFRVTDFSGNQWSIPTGIGGMPNSERGIANNFIRVEKSYFLSVDVCGSGGYPSLISIFDSSVKFNQ